MAPACIACGGVGSIRYPLGPGGQMPCPMCNGNGGGGAVKARIDQAGAPPTAPLTPAGEAMRLTRNGLQFALEVAQHVLIRIEIELAGGRRNDNDPDVNAAKLAMSTLRQRLGNVPTQPPLRQTSSLSIEANEALVTLRRVRQLVVAGTRVQDWAGRPHIQAKTVQMTLMLWDVAGARSPASEELRDDVLRAIDAEVARLNAGGLP